MSLDAYPGDEEILRRVAAGGRKGRVVDCEPRAVKLPRPPRTYPAPHFKAARNFEGHFVSCEGVIYGPARTKKNSTTLGIKQSPQYKRWCKTVVDALGRSQLPATTPLLVPNGFPRIPLNLKALFYVDSKGLPADLVGLLQGFCDALQVAGVVQDDIYIESFDGSRKLSYDTTHPRVEFWITPL